MPFIDPVVRRAYNVTWLKKRREEWLAAHGPCACGSRKRLEVDHKDPKNKVDHKVWSWSKVRRDAELSKCQVLCHECHLKKTAAHRRAQMKHGTDAMYDNVGCRCDACRARKSERNRLRSRG
jgi:hypothetical protein